EDRIDHTDPRAGGPLRYRRGPHAAQGAAGRLLPRRGRRRRGARTALPARPRLRGADGADEPSPRRHRHRLPAHRLGLVPHLLLPGPGGPRPRRRRLRHAPRSLAGRAARRCGRLLTDPRTNRIPTDDFREHPEHHARHRPALRRRRPDRPHRLPPPRRAHRPRPAPPREAGGIAMQVPEGQDIAVEAELESVVEGIYAHGTVTAHLEGECSRCLDPVDQDVTARLDELFMYPEKVRADEKEDTALLESDEVNL